MPCLAEADVARVYHSPKDDLVGGLLVPLLQRSIRIRRSTGDVQSTALSLYHESLAEFLDRNRVPGAIRWLSGTRLARRDIEAVRRRDAYIVSDLLRSLREGPEHGSGKGHDWGCQILASLLAEGLLEWKVALTTTEGVYHEKVAIFDDSCGHSVLLSGSWNETLAAYKKSVERVDVHKSSEDPFRCADGKDWFDMVWEGQVPEIRVMPVQQAIEQGRIVEIEDEPWISTVPPKPRPELWTPELLFLAVQDKVLPDLRDPYVGTLVNPLPHQSHIHRRVLARQPPAVLLADEVGLGKTIEAGMIVSTMVATGYARKVLVLAPKNVLDQWHQELWEKFQLPSWKLETGRWIDKYGKREVSASEGLFDRLPGQEPNIMLVSRSLAMRSERLKQLESTSWDIVVLDEAHRARSHKEGDKYRQNNLLIALNALSSRTKGLLLLTATPVQLELHELYDLLQPLGLPDAWKDRERFREFIKSLGSSEPDWQFLFDLSAAGERFYRDRFGLSSKDIDEDLASGVRFFEDLPPGQSPERTFQRILEVVRARAYHEVSDLSETERKLLKVALYRMSPIYQLTCRTTRSLLRRYRRLGVIQERVPERALEEPMVVDFEPDESALYNDVREKYLRPFYEEYSKAGVSRNNVGFVLSVYAKRAASSWAGLKKSLGRRLERVNRALDEWDKNGIALLFGRMAIQDLGSEEASESDQDVELEGSDEVPEVSLRGLDTRKIREIAEKELEVLRKLVQRLDNLSAERIDTKRNLVVRSIPGLVSRRRGLLIFSQFKDTVDDLADALIPEYGSELAKYHGGGGELWDGTKWVLVDKTAVERRVKSNMIRVLVATDAASEGLNLQTMDAVMNYDIPWNPMRIEQRIGRIDRLNQLSETVSVYVVLPRGTVEEEVYSRCVERIGLFRESMGPLQPILIEEFVTRAVLQGEDVGGAVNDAIDEWSTARKHAELLEEALASVLPADEWRSSREVERKTLEALVTRAGFTAEGNCWVRGKKRVSILQSVEGAEILTAAPANPVFEGLLSELGPAPNELIAGNATYKLIPCRSSCVLAVRPSAKEGWYLVRDLTRLDGSGGLHVGVAEAEVRAYVEGLEDQRLDALRRRQDEQRNQRLSAWQSDAVRFVFAPLVRLFSGDLRKAAEEMMRRDKLVEVWRIYSGSESEPRVDEVEQTLEGMRVDPRGPKKNIGLIVKAATDLLKKRPRA